MSQGNRSSNLILVAFSAFLIGFIAVLALDRAAAAGYACESGPARTTGARLAADPGHALETLRASYTARSCTGKPTLP